MSLFKKKPKKKDPVNVNQVRAQEIYSLLALCKGETELFLHHEVAFEESKIVVDEMGRIEAEVMTKMAGKFIITPGVPAVYDEFGEIVTPVIPPVYYEVQNQNKLESDLSSDLLNIPTIVADIIIYHPDYDAERKWAEFEESFEEEM